MAFGGHLSLSDHEVVEFKTFDDRKKKGRVDSRLLKELPDSVFENTAVHQRCSLFKYHLLPS